MSLTASYPGATWHREVRPNPRARSRGDLLTWRVLAWPIGLYALAVAILLWQLGEHPPYAYNWEQYTARDVMAFWASPSSNIFRPADGLMTDSGTSPLIVLPIWLAFKIGGVELLSLRIPIALLAGLTIPLVWLLGRRLVGVPTATVAALFLALTPTFLLYARTATLVGLSVTFALATALLLFRVLQRPGSWWALIGLQLLICINTYGYAPLRFFWPISLALIGWELLRRRRDWRWFLPALLITAILLPTILTIIRPYSIVAPHKRGLTTALQLYYNAGGEQIQNMNRGADMYEPFLREMPQRGADGTYQASKVDLALRLVTQNAADFANLLLDRNTKPALTDYWNPEGRLYNLILVPFFLIGLGGVAWRAWWRLEDRVLLALLLGFGLPMLLTSRVHIGRLVFFLPFLMLVVAVGVRLAATWVVWVVGRLLPRRADAQRFAARQRVALIALAAVLTVGVALSTWVDYRVIPSPRKEARIAASLGELVPVVQSRGGGVVLIMDDGTQSEIEQLALGEYQVALYDRYQFVDLAADAAPPAAGNGRPTLYYGNPMAHLDRLLTQPTACANIYYVASKFEDRFNSTAARHQATCGEPPTRLILPD